MKHGAVIILLMLNLCGQGRYLHAQEQVVSEDEVWEEADTEEVSLESILENVEEAAETSSEEPHADPAQLPATRQYADHRLPVKKFDRAHWKKVVEDTQYRRAEGTTRKDQNGGGIGGQRGSRMKDARNEPTDSSINLNFPGAGLLIRILFYGIIIAILAGIVYVIMKNVSFKSKVTLDATDATAADDIEDINDLAIDPLLKQALQDGNYRLAIRLYYLALLKTLNERTLIVWKKDKTNRDYLSELFHQPHYYQPVRTLTLAYEEVWYGDHVLAPEQFEQLTADFGTLHQQLTTSKNP